MRHVVVLGRDASLASALRTLVPDVTVSAVASPDEWPTLPPTPVAAIVVDVPRRDRATTIEDVRARCLAPMLVLITYGEPRLRFPGCTFLERPFDATTLARALAATWQQDPPSR